MRWEVLEYYWGFLPDCCPEGKVRLFPDDTTIFFHSNNINEIITTGRNIMIQLTSWFHANELTLDSEKSSFTIFKSNRKSTMKLPETIDFHNQQIKKHHN